MIIYNLNARTLTDGSVYVSYDEEGKAKSASFRTWEEFADWLKSKVRHDHT